MDFGIDLTAISMLLNLFLLSPQLKSFHNELLSELEKKVELDARYLTVSIWLIQKAEDTLAVFYISSVFSAVIVKMYLWDNYRMHLWRWRCSEITFHVYAPVKSRLIIINPSWSGVCGYVLALWSWSMCDIFRMSGLQPECRAALLCIVLGDWILVQLLYLIVGRTTLAHTYSFTHTA